MPALGEWGAAHDAPKALCNGLGHAILLKSVDGILRTRRVKTAIANGKQPGDALVRLNGGNARLLDHLD